MTLDPALHPWWQEDAPTVNHDAGADPTFSPEEQEQMLHDIVRHGVLPAEDEARLRATLAARATSGSTRRRRQPMPTLNDPQPLPQPSLGSLQGAAHWLVCADLLERAAMGQAKYGTPLQVDNGRNHLVDAYQELLDLLCYLRMAIEEQQGSAALRSPR